MSKSQCCSIDTVPFTLRDIQQYKAKYVGSNTERADIKAAYLKHKGCLIHMSADILFMDKYSEPRIKKIINSMILKGEIPSYRTYMENRAISVFKRLENISNAENKCRDLVPFRGRPQMLRRSKKRRISKKARLSKMKAITAGVDEGNKSKFQSTVSFVGEIVRGLFK